MSTISVTTVTTANATTDHTINTGNSAAGGIVIPAGGTGVVLQGNSTTNTVIANSTQVVVKAGVGINANGSVGTSGQTLMSNGSAIFWGAGSSNVQTFNASGTWTKPSSGTYAIIHAWGGGGSGGSFGGGGGGGGGYATRTILLSSLGSTETVTIGTGGAASNTSNSGSVGGTTTFGSWITAYGGSGGNGAGGTATSSVGGAGGNPFAAPLTASPLSSVPQYRAVIYATVCTTAYAIPAGQIGGGAGSAVYNLGGGSFIRDATDGQGINGYGGGGGGQAFTTSQTINSNNTSTTLGGASATPWGYDKAGSTPRTNGGNAIEGGGGGGSGKNTVAVTSGGTSLTGGGSGGAGANNTVAATAGSQPGGGGGGGSDGASNRAGAAGGDGRCIVIVV